MNGGFSLDALPMARAKKGYRQSLDLSSKEKENGHEGGIFKDGGGAEYQAVNIV